MAVDGTSIKNDIDNDLANKGYRGIRIATIITTLKKLVDWVAAAVANNVSTWLRSSDNLPGGANNEAIYRTGSVSTSGGLFAKVTNAGSGNAMNQQGFGTAGIQVVSNAAGSASFMEFHVQGVVIHQLGVDTDTRLKFRPYTSSVAYPVVIDGVTQGFTLNQSTGNRKLVLYDVGNNQHQFYGFGIDPVGLLRYVVANVNNGHAFYAADSPATSKELMRIQGNGKVGIGISAPGYILDIQAPASENGIVAQFLAQGGLGAYIQIHQGGIAVWKIGQVPGIDAFTIRGWGDGAFPERVRIDLSGNVGINTSVPTSRLHVKGPTGYQQLRLETSYTPTGVNDPNGQVGDVCWDANYFYIKSAAGWRRTAITGGW